VIVASVPAPEPGAADSVCCGNPGEDGETRGNVKVFVSVRLAKDEVSNLKVRTSGP
jgi:hypothetical protein